MKTTQQILTTATALVLGGIGGATLNNNAQAIDRPANVQMILDDASAQRVIDLTAHNACPKIKVEHGGECTPARIQTLNEHFREVRFDVFKDGDGRGMRMHARFKPPRTFKAE